MPQIMGVVHDSASICYAVGVDVIERKRAASHSLGIMPKTGLVIPLDDCIGWQAHFLERTRQKISWFINKMQIVKDRFNYMYTCRRSRFFFESGNRHEQFRKGYADRWLLCCTDYRDVPDGR